MTLGKRIAPARFVLFLALLPIAFLAYRYGAGVNDWRDNAAMAFDVAATVFLISLWPLLRDSKTDDIREHAVANDANRLLVLAITSLLTLVIMAAVSGELRHVHQGDPWAAVKLVATLLLIWLFANTVYTLHYAHAFYMPGADGEADTGGLEFPATKTPCYPDFAYFAFTLGMTFQTSDVDITAPGIRQVALLHSFAAFLFNIGVIAFSINVLGG
jgi:uncharacterized membrane protein